MNELGIDIGKVPSTQTSPETQIGSLELKDRHKRSVLKRDNWMLLSGLTEFTQVWAGPSFELLGCNWADLDQILRVRQNLRRVNEKSSIF